MRALRLVVAALLGACVHEPAVVTDLPHAPVDPTPAPAAPEPPPQYLVSDVGHEAIPLGKDGIGSIVDGVRVIVNGTRTRTAKDIADPPLVGAHKIPAWMGGGFLFRSSQALYLADAFDGPMRPLVSFPSEIDDVRFAPKYVLVHATSGQLWPVDPKTGARVVASPVGVVDVAALGDGRAIALTEFGQAWVSVDSGTKWTDVTSQLQGPTEELRLVEDDQQLWIIAQTGASARVESGGRLAFIDKAPDNKPVTLRAKDPRWKNSEFPIRRALQAGAPEGERQAIVVSEGNVARVDVLTGEILAFAPGKLPPDANCEAVRATDDVVFACARRNGSAFVASHVLADKSPTIEISFSVAGQFYASDDGGLAFGGSCSGAKTGAVVCVRNSSGGWAELELDATAGALDGGTPSLDVARWIPRADGGAYALVLTGPMPALWDARAGGSFRPLTGDSITSTSGRYHRPYKPYGSKVVDRGWSVTSNGTVRGWADNNLSSFEIRADGSVVASPFHFDTAQTAGMYALARAQGRLWQSVDRGATWTEVDPPPRGGGKGEIEISACSPLGCDLAHWYRIGWATTPPSAREDPPVAPGAARITPVPLPMLACKQNGAPKVDAVTRTSTSPEDLGLGNSKLPIANDNSDTQYVRTVFGHTTINPPHGEEGATDRDEVALRMVVSGFQTDTGSGSHFTVLGPIKDPLQLRRPVAFVAPFDPTSLVRRASYGISDLVAAARGVGMTSSDVLTEDPSMPTAVVPSLATDPLAAGDLAFATELGMVGVVRSTGRVKVTMRPTSQDTQWLVSAASIAPDDLGLLEVDANGLSHVSRWSGNAIVSLFDVPAPARPELYPANPDALAVNSKGDVGLIRTPSGGEPPTTSTPALLYQHGLPVTPLAPWSTITSADDPACKSDPGFRAIVHTVRSWIRLPPELTDTDVRMSARVKWSAQRVCLEAVEIRGPDMKAAILTRDDPNEKAYSQQQIVETWIVAKLAGGPQAIRTGVGPGLEWRQPLTCPLQP